MTITIANISFSPIVLILSIVVIVNLALAWRVWRGNPRHPVNIFFALTVLMIVLWTVTLLWQRVAEEPIMISLSVRGVYSFATLIAPLFYLFTYHFPYRTFSLSIKYYVLLLASITFVLIISIMPNLFIAGYVLPANKFKAEVSLLWHAVFGLYFLVLILLAFRNLFLKYRKNDGVWRVRIKQVIIATLVAVIGGSFFNLIMPLVFKYYQFGHVGPLFTFFMAGYIWYNVFWKVNK